MDDERIEQFKEFSNSNIKLVYSFKCRKSYYPYEYSSQPNLIVIYEDGDCFVLGKNYHGCLGSTHINDMNVEFKEPKRIKQMCNKNFKNFYNGSYHMIASTEDDKIYSWGSNTYGQLGLNFIENREEEPKPIKLLSGKNIVDIKCGDSHTLALTKDGTVYGWGDNKFGQIGKTSLVGREYEPEPIDLDFDGFKVDAIACGSMHSMALCRIKKVYSWGYNKFFQCGFNEKNMKNIEIVKPNIIKFPDNIDIIAICCGRKSSYFLSCENNDNLYSCGQSYIRTKNIFSPEKLKGHEFDKINTILSEELIVLKYKENQICYFGNEYRLQLNMIKKRFLVNEPKKSEFHSFEEFYSQFLNNKKTNRLNLTFGTLNYRKLNNKESFGNDSNQDNDIASEESNDYSNPVLMSNSNPESVAQPAEQTEWRPENVYINKYTFLYEEIKLLGKGSFGSVFEVKRKIDGKTLAIKIIDLKGKTNKEAQMFFNEMLLSSGFDNDYIVKTYAPWFENDTIYITMEVCYDTLETILKEKPKQLFNRKLCKGEIMSITEFFITSELFKEILNGVNYIHDQGLMHRDLKPQNIFIRSGLNGKFIKIGDFGLAKYLNVDGKLIKSHTQMLVGTFKYTAPEVLQNNSHYGSLRDIYSLGVIVEELYDIHKEPELTKSILLASKYKSIFDCKEKMLMRYPEKRPTCAALLEDLAKWCITYDDLKNDHQFNSLKNQIITINDIKSGFNLYFLKKRLIDYING